MTKKQITAPWYSKKGGFFGPNYFKEYIDTLTPERTKTEVDFIEKALGLKKNMKILDLACGHGRHIIELAKRGYNITGQDINSFFLKEAKEAAKRAGVKVRWVKKDMRQIPFENEFNVVLNLFTAFGYLENDEEDQKVIHQVAKALRTNGKFFIDTINRDRIMREHREKDWKELKNGSIMVIERRFDFSTGRNYERRLIIEKNGGREEFNLLLRMYTLPELIKMCKNAGLSFKTSYGDYTGEKVSMTSERYVLVTEKNNNLNEKKEIK